MPHFAEKILFECFSQQGTEPVNQQPQIQVFGSDFILDENNNVYFIEINAGPSHFKGFPFFQIDIFKKIEQIKKGQTNLDYLRVLQVFSH
jgi:hypothetical protein